MRWMVLILVTSQIVSRYLHRSLRMGARKMRHPPKFIIEPDYQIFRDLLMRWIEKVSLRSMYTHDEMASLILEGLPPNIKMECVAEIGESFLGKKSLLKMVQWLDCRYDSGWNNWLDNAKKDVNCYETFIPIPRGPLTFRMFEKYKAYPKIEGHVYHGVTFFPEEFQTFELWPGNMFKKYKEVAEYTGRYFKKKVLDPNSVKVGDYNEVGILIGEHYEKASEYDYFIDKDVENYNVSHLAFTH